MSSQAYVGLSQRTFAQALIHRLESLWPAGQPTVLELLAQGSNSWWSNFIPNLNGSAAVGWSLPESRANGHKAYPGDQAAD
ncbi:MAG: hypothetical protein U0401_26995 [Anaerolineae bacterium]